MLARGLRRMPISGVSAKASSSPIGEPVGHRVAEHHDVDGRGRRRGGAARARASIQPAALLLRCLVRWMPTGWFQRLLLLLLLLVAPLPVFQERKALVDLRGGRTEQRAARRPPRPRPRRGRAARARSIRAEPVCGLICRHACYRWVRKAGSSPPSAHRPSARQKCQLEDRRRLKRGLIGPQPLQNRRGGKAVRNQAAAGLEIAHRDCGSCCRAARSARRHRSRGD